MRWVFMGCAENNGGGNCGQAATDCGMLDFVDPDVLPARFEAVRFTRPASGKALGCVAYILAIPVLSVFVGLAVVAIAFPGIKALGGSEDLAAILGILFGGSALIGIVAWGFRSWRRESAAEIVIDADRVTVSKGGSARILMFDDIESIRIRELIYRDQALLVTTRAGGRFRIPPDIAPIDGLVKALRPTLMAHQVRRLESRLQSGERIDVRQSGSRSAFLLVQALLAGLLAIGTVFHVFHAVNLALHAIRLARLAFRGLKGGVRISRDELRAAGGTMPNLAWDGVTCTADAYGLVLEDRSGRRLALPMSADNYLPALALIENRVSASKGK